MKLLYLSMLAFVLVSSTALASVKKEELIKAKEVKTLSPLPVLSVNSSFPIVSAQGVIAVDLDSGVVLYEKNPDLGLLPASTTKIMTALVAMEYYPKDFILKIGKIRVDGQKMGLIEGETIRVESLLYGLLVYSANDAAEALAQGFPGGKEAFVEKMNIKAVELHLDRTRFVNPTGLDGMDHFSTARDMVRLSEFAMRNPLFSEIVNTRQITVTSIDGKIIHKLRNINELLWQVEGVKGVKTGWTENARENLVTYVERDGKRIMIATLGSQDRFGESKELIEWIFENYDWQPVTYSP